MCTKNFIRVDEVRESPAWFLGRNPSERVVAVSYSEALARSHANDFRLLVNHPIYQTSFPAMRL